ncbi:MAG: family 43 glycosylhydrolase [Puniceicoccaceae bacterium]
MPTTVQNPILPGSHPDPDIIRVGEDFYLATTTFEWLPGVRIHHSRDLVNWKLVAAPLDGKRIGNLHAVPDSGGNYIPSLSWHRGTFYLLYSEVYDGVWPWVANRTYLTIAPSIEGPWTEPVHLNSMAFDPALFFDDDDRCYLLHLWMDYRAGKQQMRGIAIHELDLAGMQLIGEARELFTSPPGFLNEGPHIFKRGGYYYLSTAIWGTWRQHATMVARAKKLTDPFEVDPENPMLTSFDDASHPLQKAGQGCFLDIGEDQWILAHHVGRFWPGVERCPLGRETCLQNIEWSEAGWPRIVGGWKFPNLSFSSPFEAEIEERDGLVLDSFEEAVLDPEWNTLREPAEESWLSLSRSPGRLSLRGRLPITSKVGQSLLARRWTQTQFTASTQIHFEPRNEATLAGLICYYDTMDFVWAAISRDETEGRILSLIERRPDRGFQEQFVAKASLPDGPIELKVAVSPEGMQFGWRTETGDWTRLGDLLEVGHLSDEGLDGTKKGFTGSFIGLAAHDMQLEQAWAEFEWFRLTPGIEE